jgi:ribonuclease P protein component
MVSWCACIPRTAASCSNAAAPKGGSVSRSPLSGNTDKLRRRAEFTRVFEQGIRLRGRFMTCFALPNGLTGARIGIAASAKMGNAVARNRAKRLVRELFRAHVPSKPIDLVFVPRREMIRAAWPDLEADYCAALHRIAKL